MCFGGAWRYSSQHLSGSLTSRSQTLMIRASRGESTSTNHTHNHSDSRKAPIPSGAVQVAPGSIASRTPLGGPKTPRTQPWWPRAFHRPTIGGPKPFTDLNLEPLGAPGAPTWRPQTFNFAHHYGTLATFSIIVLLACKFLLDCFLGAL